MSRIGLVLVAVLACCSCGAEESDRNPSNWRELANQAAEATREAVEEINREPRVAARGAVPELIVRSDEILFNGQHLKIGDDISKWKRVLGPPSRWSDHFGQHTWDNFGLEAGVDYHEDRSGEVVGVRLHLNPKPDDGVGELVTERPDGTPVEPFEELTPPKHVFSGYVALDTIGVDAKTETWELETWATDESTNLRCGDTIRGYTEIVMSLRKCYLLRADGKRGYRLSFPSTEIDNKVVIQQIEVFGDP